MELDTVWTIAKKDLADIRKNRMILLPLIVVPVIFAIVIPASSVFGLADAGPQDYQVLLYMLTAGLIPLFVLVPAAISNVIASYSFVGEKNEKTLEPLLATPTTDSELLMGKLLAAFLPAFLATMVAFVLMTTIVDYVTYPTLGYFLLPNANWLIAIFLLAPLIALAAITITIIFSARMSDPRAVQQMSVLVILPFLGLFFGGIAQVVSLDLSLMGVLLIALIVADWLLFSIAKRLFERETILTKWK